MTRIIMMGTGPFAVPTFESLLDSDYEVVVLVTRPTATGHKRRKTRNNPMRDVAEARGVEVLSPDDINGTAARTQIAALRPDLFVVCDYGQILSRETLGISALGGINLHGSVLPKYRGAAPVHWAILNGDTETGVTVIHMTPRLDAGPVLSWRATVIQPDETTAELEPRLAQLGVETVHEAISMLARWDREAGIGTLQDQSLACRAPRLKKSDGQVDWSRTATQIYNQVRGLKPWPGTFTNFERQNGQIVRLILDDVRVVQDQTSVGPPGAVVVADGKQLCISTGSGSLSIRRLQPAGKRVMEIEEFLRGYSIEVGHKFG